AWKSEMKATDPRGPFKNHQLHPMRGLTTLPALSQPAAFLAALLLTVPGCPFAHGQDARESPASPRVTAFPDFAAVGDGRADATAALQRAIDSGMGAVRLPRGVYRITKPIRIDLDRVGFTSLHGDDVARILMAGEGPALQFVGTHEGSADPATFKSNVWQRQRMPLVDGLEIVGGHERAVGIELRGTMQVTVTRTLIRECLHGVHLVERNRNVIISDSHIYHQRGIGVFFDQVNLHQANIVGTHVSYCAGGGIVFRGGEVRNVHIGACDIESNQGPDSPPTANILIDSGGSPYGTAEVAITGCTIQHNSKSPGSANIRVLGRGAASPRSSRHEQWGHITIAGNVLSDVMTNIHLSGARGVTLTGNTFWPGYEYNLLVEDCQQIVLSANVLDRNPACEHRPGSPSRNAIVFRGSRDCTINALHVHGVAADAGVFLEDCDRFNVTDCTILDCDDAGLLARNLTCSRISGCLIRDDREHPSEPLRIEGGSENQILDNHLGSPNRESSRQVHEWRGSGISRDDSRPGFVDWREARARSETSHGWY
ncbi:MAG: right-handed parallel beta-helix repeat-containing protein, partial [Opitutaceae bacterium]